MAVGVERGGRVERTALWQDARFRALILQIVVVVALVAFALFIVRNTAENLSAQGQEVGFGFLSRISGFDIGFQLIDYKLTSTYGRAFLVGLVNTLFVSAVGVVLATLLGFLVGVLRLSRNWLIAKLAAVYVESLRNVPLLLQIIFWYFGVLAALPSPRNSINIADLAFINIKAISIPRPIFEPGFAAIPIALFVAILAVFALSRWARRRQEATGEQFPTVRIGLALIVGLPLLAALVTGIPLSWSYPALKGFNFAGGIGIPPEFVALLIALTMYTAAFIAEIVRGGIQSVSHGQTEAAYALGLRSPTSHLASNTTRTRAARTAGTPQ